MDPGVSRPSMPCEYCGGRIIALDDGTIQFCCQEQKATYNAAWERLKKRCALTKTEVVYLGGGDSLARQVDEALEIIADVAWLTGPEGFKRV